MDLHQRGLQLPEAGQPFDSVCMDLAELAVCGYQGPFQGRMLGDGPEHAGFLPEDPAGGGQHHRIGHRSAALQLGSAGREVTGQVQEGDHVDRGHAARRCTGRPGRQAAPEPDALPVVGNDDADRCKGVAALGLGHRFS